MFLHSYKCLLNLLSNYKYFFLPRVRIRARVRARARVRIRVTRVRVRVGVRAGVRGRA